MCADRNRSIEPNQPADPLSFPVVRVVARSVLLDAFDDAEKFAAKIVLAGSERKNVKEFA
jgi:hypothetical protein